MAKTTSRSKKPNPPTDDDRYEPNPPELQAEETEKTQDQKDIRSLQTTTEYLQRIDTERKGAIRLLLERVESLEGVVRRWAKRTEHLEDLNGVKR